MYHRWVCDFFFFFFHLVLIQSTQFFIGSTYLLESCFWWSSFPLNCQNAYGHKTFQSGAMLRAALTHKYAWHLNRVVLLGHVTNKIHIHIQKMYWHHNRQGDDLMLEAPKHDPLIKWPTWGHVATFKIYISIFMRFIANKLGSLLTLGRIFRTQTLKSSPISCFKVFILNLYRESFYITTIFI